MTDPKNPTPEEFAEVYLAAANEAVAMSIMLVPKMHAPFMLFAMREKLNVLMATVEEDLFETEETQAIRAAIQKNCNELQASYQELYDKLLEEVDEPLAEEASEDA